MASLGRVLASLAGVGITLGTSACVTRNAGAGESASGTDDDTAGDATTITTGTTPSTHGEAGDEAGEDTGPPPPAPRQIDILFVIDNSGSMGEEQGALVASMAKLVNVLEAEDIGYRIGITTTDNGNPWCSGTTPEGGALRMTSCRSRLDEFVFTGAPPTDRTNEGCLDFCNLETVDIQPTATPVDPEPKSHPWIENIGGVTNVSDDHGIVEALVCALPQGINGCGFESQLESMYKALRRTLADSELSYGFIRPDAHLMVVLLTDEVDCSFRVEHEAIFLPEGDRVFWSDPDLGYPTSALCWNAGTACDGGPGTYDGCHAQNYDPSGNPTTDDASVLHPLSRYVDLMRELEAEKRAVANASVMFAAIVGVPQGYESGQEIVYQDTQDSQFQADYGIGPGCSSAKGVALPPVRVRELAEALADQGRNLYSVCDQSYDGAVKAIAQAILDRVG